MKLNHLPSEFQKALPILEKIRQNGYEAYFVGGSVRDVLLDRPIHDVDIATSAYPLEIKTIFSRTVDIGIEHGTVLVLNNHEGYEVTTFRTEDLYVDYRRPSQVSFVRSLEEDLKRRDFTVNAFALTKEGLIIDKFNGLSDLKQKLLRAVGVAKERFQEDALRILRGFRFSAHLDFSIESETFLAMVESSYLLEKISVERSFIEMDKLVMAPFWKKGISYLIESRAYRYLPELEDKVLALHQFVTQSKDDFIFESSEQAWSALLLALDVQDVRYFLKKWKTSVQFQKAVSTIVSLYRLRLKTNFDPYTFYQNDFTLLEQAESLRVVFGLMPNYGQLEMLQQTRCISDKSDIVVNGLMLISDCDYKPGPNLGKILNCIEKEIVMGRLENEYTAILKFISEEENE